MSNNEMLQTAVFCACDVGKCKEQREVAKFGLVEGVDDCVEVVDCSEHVHGWIEEPLSDERLPD